MIKVRAGATNSTGCAAAFSLEQSINRRRIATQIDDIEVTATHQLIA